MNKKNAFKKLLVSTLVLTLLCLSILSSVSFADKAFENANNDSANSHLSSVTLLVKQPVLGSRNCLNPNTYDVGHTFLRIYERSSKKITYTGFYPKNSIGRKQLLLASSVAGETKDDSTHDWDVAIKYYITDTELTRLNNYINNNKSKNYNILSYNCSTFAVEAINSMRGGHSVPSPRRWTIPSPIDSNILAKIRNWTGYCPADLGEDIKLLRKVYMTKDSRGNVTTHGLSGGAR